MNRSKAIVLTALGLIAVAAFIGFAAEYQLVPYDGASAYTDSPGRFQMADSGGTLYRIDTCTGQSWYLGSMANGEKTWYEIEE